MGRKVGLSLVAILFLIAIIVAFNFDEKPSVEQNKVVQQVESVVLSDSLSDYTDEQGTYRSDGEIDTE